MTEKINNRPFLTENLPGTGGTIKNHTTDFYVEEIPLYEPSGHGTHLYFEIEKTGMPTMEAIKQIARALSIHKQDIGYAGQKDAKAVTRQWLSIEHIMPDQLENITVPDVTIFGSAYHKNKLKLSHLSGNIFSVKIRDIEDIDKALDQANAITEVLTKRGVPNYYGSQRFGHRNDTHLLGAAIIGDDDEKLVDLIMGHPHPSDPEEARQAREFFDNGQYIEAASAWPKRNRTEIQIAWLLYDGKPAHKATRLIDKQQRRFYISAFQSELFNKVLASRLKTIDKVLDGDIACIGNKGPNFDVQEPEKEQPRCDAYEIHPTGPIFGHKMQMPQEGTELDIESQVLKELDLKLEDFKGKSARMAKGARRPLRFIPKDFTIAKGSDEHGEFLETKFTLPPGCYATTVLREIIKDSTL
ncbi:MAG: tRNA pseudouridine(13) synthase TruD [Phycisphaerae bacterium]|nr:tRNA pseudouridine(13) synthase TruD [Phycisphaerae bacterium]